jgi:cob(I)alamin adenosyltransferase
MAGKALAANLARLIERGRPPGTPAAYIAAATTPQQRIITGTLATLAQLTADVDPAAPALVIVGDVVSLRERIAWFAPGPLAGRRLLVGRARPEPSAVAAALRALGGEVVEAPEIAVAAVAAVDDTTVLDAALGRQPGSRGLVVVYTGQGKGKTTAALGMVFRALGRGMRVAVVQFIKGKWKTGERRFAETLPGLTFLVMGKGFTWNSDDLSRDRAAAQAAWATAKQLIGSGAHAVVVLDEITFAINYGFIELADVLSALRDRPPEVHVVLTGRNAPDELRAAADLVTEMTCVKHPFERGVAAQPGIDY